jgi:serine/threonine protein kinase
MLGHSRTRIESKSFYMHEMELDLRRDVDPNKVYELLALLGEGSYGAVYKGTPRVVDEDFDPASGETNDVAIKIIPDADDDLGAWREIKFLQVWNLQS